MCFFTAPAMAQQQELDPIQDQAAGIIKTGDAKQMQAFAKQYKKDAAALTSIGKAYYAVKDYEAAKNYAQQAIAILAKNSKGPKNAGPYVLMGNIAVSQDNGGEAAGWFEQAIYADPKCPDGYRRYAEVMQKADPRGAEEKLQALAREVPGYPIDLIAADIYAEAGKPAKAVEYYSKVKLDDMKDYQIGRYAFNLFVQQKYDKSLEVVTYGQKKFPRSATLNRLALYDNTALKNYDAALVAADLLFNQSDSVKIVSDDYGQLINALRGAKKYDEALVQLGKLANDPSMPKADQLFAQKQIADTYADKEDYARAIPEYQKYLAANEKPSATDVAALGSMYQYYAQQKTGAEQKALLDKADQVFVDLEAKFPDAAEYATHQRARVAMQKDPDSKQGLAKPFYDKLIDMPGVSQNRLKEAYLYNMAYYFIVKGDQATATSYAEKILAIDPENEQAKNVLSLQQQ